MKFRTEIELPRQLAEIRHPEGILLMGSCFAEYTGQRLEEEKFNCTANPFGILFNPVSILAALRRLQAPQPFTEADLVSHNGLWHSLMHHGSFSTPSPAETLRLIHARYHDAARRFAHCRTLLLTWGTAYVYFHKERGHVVANCHKLPADQFERRRLSVEEIARPYEEFLGEWLEAAPGRQIILTVSPVRHLRDGLHENQISKSTLLLAADKLCQSLPGRVLYFPAYEIVMDELRDYRFYDSDMLHPSPVAREYVYERFADCCFTPQTRQAAAECGALARMLRHRPLHPQGSQHAQFVQKIKEKINLLQTKYPYLGFEKETESCLIP